jgi:hypothetical protein
MDAGPEPIGDDTERALLRRQAHGIHLRSLLAAAGLTVLFLLL